MKKLRKRLGALMMTLAMVLSLGAGITAFAAEDSDPLTQTITLIGVTSGDTVIAYRLVEYTDTTYTSYTFNGGFDTFLKNQSDYGTSASAEAYLSTKDSDAVAKLIRGFADVCGTSTYSFPIGDDKIEVAADAGNQAVFENLAPGYYMIMVTSGTLLGGKLYTPNSAVISVKSGVATVAIGGNVIATPYTAVLKSENAPTIDKQVKDEDAGWQGTNTVQVGDTVEYRVEIKFPGYGGKVTDINLTLADTMTNLTYNNDVKVCKPGGTEIPGAVTATDTTTPGTVKWTLDYSAFGATDEGGVTVYVCYSATVNADAADTNNARNSVTLTYSDALTPDEKATTTADTTNTYMFSIDLKKVDSDGATPLAGAKFKVYNSETGTTPISFIEDNDTNGTYYRPFITGDTGTVVTEIPADFRLKGLDEDDYWLEESTVPEGYYAPAGTGITGSDRFKVTLDAAYSTGTEYSGELNAENSKAVAVNEANNGLIVAKGVNTTDKSQYDITIKNSDVPVLPTTGGMGTMLFTVLGVVLMALAAGLFFFCRRKNA